MWPWPNESSCSQTHQTQYILLRQWDCFLRKLNKIKSINGISNKKYLSWKGGLINIWLSIKKIPQHFVLETRDK